MLPRSWGGSEFLWSQTALRIAQQSHEVYVSVEFRRDEPPVLQQLEELGTHVIRRNAPIPLPPPAALPERCRRWVARKINPPRAHRMSELETLKLVQPQLTVISQPTCVEGVEWMLACQKNQTPYVTVAQSCHDQIFYSDEFADSIEPAMMGAVRSYFVADDNRRKVENFLAASLPAPEIVRNPFQVQYQQQFQWPSCDSHLKLANVARLHIPSKGQDVLLQVLALDKWRERNIEVGFFGEGPNENRLQQLSAKLNLQNTRFHGHVSDIEALWRDHHALVMPSRHEGLPIALIEAMLCGRPAVVTDVAGFSEIVRNGETGFIAAAPTVSAFDKAMEELWQARAQLSSMGIESARHIRTCVPEDPVGTFAAKLLSLTRKR